MTHRFALSALALAFAAGALSACSSPGITGSPATTGATAAAAARPHWTRVSIGTFADPYGVAVSQFCAASCDVFVADAGAKKVYKIAPDGTRTSIGDFAEAANFDPQGVAVDRFGNVYVADKEPGAKTTVWKIDPKNVTGPVPLLEGYPHQYFRGVAIIYSDPSASNVCVVAVQASYVPGLADGGFLNSCLKTRASFSDPFAVSAGVQSSPVYVADPGTKTVYATNFTAIARSPLRRFVDPYGVASSLDGRYVYVADAGGKRVWMRDPDGAWSVVGDFADPYGVAVDGSGTVYVADPGSKSVWKLTP